MRSFFRPKDVKELVRIPYWQLQYWDKTNFIQPSYRRHGKYRLYTFSDLIQLKVAEVMKNHGFSLQQLRLLIENLKGLLPRLAYPLADHTFLIQGQRILAFNGEVLMNPSDENYIRFDAKALREEINKLFPETAVVPKGTTY